MAYDGYNLLQIHPRLVEYCKNHGVVCNDPETWLDPQIHGNTIQSLMNKWPIYSLKFFNILTKIYSTKYSEKIIPSTSFTISSSICLIILFKTQNLITSTINLIKANIGIDICIITERTLNILDRLMFQYCNCFFLAEAELVSQLFRILTYNKHWPIIGIILLHPILVEFNRLSPGRLILPIKQKYKSPHKLNIPSQLKYLIIAAANDSYIDDALYLGKLLNCQLVFDSIPRSGFTSNNIEHCLIKTLTNFINECIYLYGETKLCIYRPL